MIVLSVEIATPAKPDFQIGHWAQCIVFVIFDTYAGISAVCGDMARIFSVTYVVAGEENAARGIAFYAEACAQKPMCLHPDSWSDSPAVGIVVGICVAIIRNRFR